jgi:hypothetical protein
MKTALLFAWLLLPAMASTQDSLNEKRPAFLYALATYDFPRSYGFTIGTSIPFHSIIIKKVDKEFNTRNFKKDELISADLGGYRYPLAYTAITVNAGLGLRYNKSAKHFNELYFNQGIFRTFYDGNVYELDPDGNIKERKLFGRTYLTTGFSYSMNWSLKNRNSNLWFIQVRPAFWIQYPYNSFLKPHVSIQAGTSYHLQNVTLRTRTKHRYLS